MEEYLEGKKRLQQAILDYIGCNDENQLQLLQDVKNALDEQNFQENQYELAATLYLILNISNNYYRFPNFFQKIDEILLYLKNDIKQAFSNFEIFNLFKSNKRILLFLLEKGLLIFDEYIAKIFSKEKYQKSFYNEYFYPEIKDFLDEEQRSKIEKEINEITGNDLEKFKSMRKNGENHYYICELIRNDSVQEFISYVNENSIPLSSTLNSSIFETNSFLLEIELTSLIEYALFFGSFQIVRYLFDYKVELHDQFWLFAIHGGNPSLIHFLEYEEVKLEGEIFGLTFNEAVKSHQINITNYLLDKYASNHPDDYEKIFICGLKYYNYSFFTKNFDNNIAFDYLCRYGHITIIDFLLKNEVTSLKINSKIIQYLSFLI